MSRLQLKDFRWPATAYDAFYPKAHHLRHYYEEIFADARAAEPRRLVFEPWWIENQFYHLKTPAGLFFPPQILDPFMTFLLNWGRTRLGCQMVSPPWLSLYLDGHFQNWHADNPQGPFAFVFSLTRSSRAFRGGRTLIMQPSTLSYWNQTEFRRGVEIDQLQTTYESKFNRLLVFDPRLPHAVETVKNVFDPLQGRLVIHGWFSDPRPTIEGGLGWRAAQSFFEEAVPEVLARETILDDIRGYTCLKFFVQKSGEVKKTDVMVSTLVNTSGDRARADKALRQLIRSLQPHRFKPSKSSSVITLPLIFS